jgi:hypothetical protein
MFLLAPRYILSIDLPKLPETKANTRGQSVTRTYSKHSDSGPQHAVRLGGIRQREVSELRGKGKGVRG